MASPKRKAQWGHYPPVVPEIQLDDSGITVGYNTNGALEISTDYGLIDTGNPGNGIVFTGPDVDNGSYEISVDPIYFNANYLRNDGDTGVGDYEFTGALNNNGNQVWHPGNDGAASGLDADKLHGLLPDTTSTVSTIVARDSSGNIDAVLLQSSFATQAGYPGANTSIPFRNNNTTDRGLRFMDQSSMNTWVHQKDSGCVQVKTSAHSFPNNVHTVFIPGTTLTDKLSEFNAATGRFTPNVAGYYSFFGRVLIQSTSWAVSRVIQLSIFLDGNIYIAGPRLTSQMTTSQQIHPTVSGVFYLAAGSYADIRLFHNQGTSLLSTTDGDYNGITIARVA